MLVKLDSIRKYLKPPPSHREFFPLLQKPYSSWTPTTAALWYLGLTLMTSSPRGCQDSSQQLDLQKSICWSHPGNPIKVTQRESLLTLPMTKRYQTLLVNSQTRKFQLFTDILVFCGSIYFFWRLKIHLDNFFDVFGFVVTATTFLRFIRKSNWIIHFF